MNRYLIVFAREPEREARAKGLGAPGRDLFGSFALGWSDAALWCEARLVLATPAEDAAAWRRVLGTTEPIWLVQRGLRLGDRLAGIVAQTAGLQGHCVLVGGDTPPSALALREAFEALERGADSVLAPAADGGVSLLAMSPGDSDLLASIAPRQRGVASKLTGQLRARRRSVVIVRMVADVDGRRSLRSMVRLALTGKIRSLARRVLRARSFAGTRPVASRPHRRLAAPSGLRAPPRSA